MHLTRYVVSIKPIYQVSLQIGYKYYYERLFSKSFYQYNKPKNVFLTTPIGYKVRAGRRREFLRPPSNWAKNPDIPIIKGDGIPEGTKRRNKAIIRTTTMCYTTAQPLLQNPLICGKGRWTNQSAYQLTYLYLPAKLIKQSTSQSIDHSTNQSVDLTGESTNQLTNQFSQPCQPTNSTNYFNQPTNSTISTS